MILGKRRECLRSAQGWAFFQNDQWRSRPFQAQVYDPALGGGVHVGSASTLEEGRALARAYLRVREAVPAAPVKAARTSAARLREDLASGQAQLPLGDALAACWSSDHAP